MVEQGRRARTATRRRGSAGGGTARIGVAQVSGGTVVRCPVAMRPSGWSARGAVSATWAAVMFRFVVARGGRSAGRRARRRSRWRDRLFRGRGVRSSLGVEESRGVGIETRAASARAEGVDDGGCRTTTLGDVGFGVRSDGLEGLGGGVCGGEESLLGTSPGQGVGVVEVCLDAWRGKEIEEAAEGHVEVGGGVEDGIAGEVCGDRGDLVVGEGREMCEPGHDSTLRAARRMARGDGRMTGMLRTGVVSRCEFVGRGTCGWATGGRWLRARTGPSRSG